MSGYACKIVLDSKSEGGKRITSIQATLPLIIQNEMLTHRAFSRGSASSRAIPVKKMIQSVYDSPFIPDKWYRNAKGMQPGAEITDKDTIDLCLSSWLRSRDQAALEAEFLSTEMDVAKEIANRLLGPFFWSTMIITSTHWCNFFNLRCHPMAQRQIRVIAEMMRDRFMMSVPVPVKTGGLHAPYTLTADWADICIHPRSPKDHDKTFSQEQELILQVATGRVARVSYVNQDGIRDVNDDIKLYNRLIAQIPLHAGPLEHSARALANPYTWSGNFMGWEQYRKTMKDESLNEYTHNGITISDMPSLEEPNGE